jgi:chondroitin AC lyase
MRQCNIFIYFLLFFICCVSSNVPNDDVSIIRQRVLDLMLLPSKNNINETVYNALTYNRTLNSSCYWPDIVYNDTQVVDWRTAEHLVRITNMLQAIIVNGSKIQNDRQIRAAVHCALNVWLVNDWRAPNWYHNEIYVPILVTGQLLMLGDNVTNFEIEKITEISYRAAWWYHKPRDVSANVIWMIQAEIYRSLATNNLTGLVQGFTRMWEDIAVQSADTVGIQYDQSYHFHGTQLLNGAYGMGWAQNIFAFIVCSLQTKYEPNKQQFSTFAQFITEGDAWMIIRTYWDWHPLGRAVSRPDAEYQVHFDTKLMRKVAESIDSNDTKINLLNFADRLDGYLNASVLIGNRHFFVSDYQVHHRKNWTCAIKMQSIRTQPIECNNGENIKAEHSGQGVLNLYTDNTYDYENIFPLFDWQAINGVTLEHGIPLEPCTNESFLWQNVSFVGGVSDGQYGLALMDTASHNLTAQRSWHFYDDAIIALATNATLTTQTSAWTTLASRLLRTGRITIGFFNSTVITLSDGNYSFPYVQGKASNVQWIHLEGSDIGYLLHEQQQYAALGIEFGNKTGNYHDIGAFNVTVSARVVTMWIDHGIGPFKNLDYNYMILPNVSREAVPTLIRQYEEEQLFSCLSTNNHFHGTIWPSLKRASFVLWENVTTKFSCRSPLFEINIELNNAGAYLFSETAADFTVTVSHPMRIGGDIKVIVDRVGFGQGCAASSDVNANTTNVTLSLPSSDHLLGASVNVKCKK